MPVLQANEIRKSFKEGREVVNVLNGVSLSLEPGEVTALEGPSGSGKTTLLSIIGCILTPNSGDLFIDGERVDPKRSDRLPGIRRRAIGFVFQQFNLFPALTALFVPTEGSLGWTEAADRDCASIGRKSEGFARGRAHRESRLANGDADSRFVSCAGETGEPSTADRHP